MQDGVLDRATEEKLRLEEKQRQARKDRKVSFVDAALGLGLGFRVGFRLNPDAEIDALPEKLWAVRNKAVCVWGGGGGA